MNRLDVIKELANAADLLDEIGLIKEANEVTEIMKKFASETIQD